MRAVARACATNPVAIAVPCHRVIGSDGSLTGYRWGVERKKKLLARWRQAGLQDVCALSALVRGLYSPPALRRRMSDEQLLSHAVPLGRKGLVQVQMSCEALIPVASTVWKKGASVSLCTTAVCTFPKPALPKQQLQLHFAEAQPDVGV